MAWIEVHQALRDHRKTWALAAELDMPEAHVSGHVIYLWLWALDNAQEGQLPKSSRLIERAAGWEGEAGALAHALVSVGFVDEDEDGVLWLHDWELYTGRLIGKRMADAERKRNERKSTSRPLDVQRTSDGHPRDGARTNTTNRTNTTEPTEAAHDDERAERGAASAAAASEPATPQEAPKTKRERKYSGEEQAYVSAVLTGIKAINGTKGALPTEGRERQAAHWFYRANDKEPVPVDDVLDLYRTVKARAFWQGKYLSLQSLEAEYTEYRRDPATFRAAAKANAAPQRQRASPPPERRQYGIPADQVVHPFGRQASAQPA